MSEIFRNFPAPVLWAQRRNKIYIKVFLKYCSSPSFKVEKDKIYFSSKSEKIDYEITLELLKDIKTEEIKFSLTKNIMEVTVYKITEEFWTSLLKETKEGCEKELNEDELRDYDIKKAAEECNLPTFPVSVEKNADKRSADENLEEIPRKIRKGGESDEILHPVSTPEVHPSATEEILLETPHRSEESATDKKIASPPEQFEDAYLQDIQSEQLFNLGYVRETPLPVSAQEVLEETAGTSQTRLDKRSTVYILAIKAIINEKCGMGVTLPEIVLYVTTYAPQVQKTIVEFDVRKLTDDGCAEGIFKLSNDNYTTRYLGPN